VFAAGAGIFFVGYFIFEVPANLILHRTGARLWIARIMISWGIISTLMAFSYNATSFYILRFLLGVAEAGFFPGIILYLTYWFPREHRAHMTAMFMTAVAAAGILGSPISGWILQVSDGWHGLHSWQWLFILEGTPSILLGLLVPLLLTDRPEHARWLTSTEKSFILEKIDIEQHRKLASGEHAFSLKDAFRSKRIWICCLTQFTIVFGLYGASFWLPQIIHETLTPIDWQIGLYSALPWTCAAFGMVLVCRHSDRTGERRLHVGLSALTAAFAFAASGLPGIPGWARLLALAVAVTGVMSTTSCFWSVPTAMLSGTAAAAGIAWINSVGNLAGLVAPELFRWMKSHHGMGTALLGLAAIQACAGILALVTIQPKRN
jgi:MFS family permease